MGILENHANQILQASNEYINLTFKKAISSPDTFYQQEGALTWFYKNNELISSVRPVTHWQLASLRNIKMEHFEDPAGRVSPDKSICAIYGSKKDVLTNKAFESALMALFNKDYITESTQLDFSVDFTSIKTQDLLREIFNKEEVGFSVYSKRMAIFEKYADEFFTPDNLVSNTNTTWLYTKGQMYTAAGGTRHVMLIKQIGTDKVDFDNYSSGRISGDRKILAVWDLPTSSSDPNIIKEAVQNLYDSRLILPNTKIYFYPSMTPVLTKDYLGIGVTV